MKKNISSLIVIGILTLVGFSSCKHKAEDVIADAKKTVADINNNLKDYKSKRVDDLTSIEPGTITGYYREEEVKKVYAEHYGDTSRTFTEYYFDDGMLICALVQDFIYNKPNTYTEEKARRNNDSVWYDDKKTKMQQSSFYFSNNKMIKWINAGKEIPPADPDFYDKQSELWAQTAILIKELKEQ